MSAIYTIKQETLAGIADAIREKSDTVHAYNPTEMAAAILSIKTGGTAFNIAYGDTAPEDTTKLWVKSEPPARVKVTSRLGAANEEMTFGVGTLPVATDGIAAAAVGTKVYLFGGRTDAGRVDTIHVWDTETYAISTLSTRLPAAAQYISAAVIGKKIYLFGGYGDAGSLNSIHVFDTETNAISTLSAKLPTATARMASAAVGAKVYLFGGLVGYSSVDRICVFNSETGAISTLGVKLSEASEGLRWAAVGTNIYLFGGYGKSGWLDTTHVFDTQTDTISKLSTTLPSDVGVAYSATASVGAKVYLFGGRKTNNYNTNAIGVYDVIANSISILGATYPAEQVEFVSAATVGAKVYLFGGNDNSRLSGIHEFVAALPLEQDTILIEASVTDNVFNLVANDNEIAEIGIANVYCGDADGIAQKISAALYVDEVWTEI